MFQHQKTRQRRSEGTQQNKEASMFTCTWPPDLSTCECRITRGPAKKSNCLEEKALPLKQFQRSGVFISPLFFKCEINVFIDMFSWWSRTAEKAKQEPTEVIDRNPKAARLGFLIIPDPISAAHVTGTSPQNDSGVQTIACYGKLDSSNAKRSVYFLTDQSQCHVYSTRQFLVSEFANETKVKGDHIAVFKNTSLQACT